MPQIPPASNQILTVDQLAREFSRILRDRLTPKQLSHVVALNRSEINPSICHSHDVCDPNQAMIDALESFGIEWSTELGELIDAAWEISRSSDFIN